MIDGLVGIKNSITHWIASCGSSCLKDLIFWPPFYGTIKRGGRRGIPKAPKYIENAFMYIISLAAGIALATFVDAKVNGHDIKTNAENIEKNTMSINKISDKQEALKDELNKNAATINENLTVIKDYITKNPK